MTTIAAFHSDGVTVIGADGRSTQNTFITTETKNKLQRVNSSEETRVVGVAGDAPIAEIVAETIAKTLTRDIRGSALMEAIRDSGAEKHEGSGSLSFPFEAILTSGHDIYALGPDAFIGKVDPGIPVAVGSGGEVAIGAMEIAAERGLDAQAVVRAGLRIATMRDSATGPVHFFCIWEQGFLSETTDFAGDVYARRRAT